MRGRKFYDIEEASFMLGISVEKIKEAIRYGIAPHPGEGFGKPYIWDSKQLKELADAVGKKVPWDPPNPANILNQFQQRL